MILRTDDSPVPRSDDELDAWDAALEHLRTAGFPGIAPPDVVDALAARPRRRRCHLRAVR